MKRAAIGIGLLLAFGCGAPVRPDAETAKMAAEYRRTVRDAEQTFDYIAANRKLLESRGDSYQTTFDRRAEKYNGIYARAFAKADDLRRRLESRPRFREWFHWGESRLLNLEGEGELFDLANGPSR